MSIQITDDGATILVKDTAKDVAINFNKRVSNVKRQGSKLMVQDGRQLSEFEFATVTVPLAANPEALRAEIEVLLETPTGISGINIAPESPTNISVSSVSVEILPENLDRIWVSITNLGNKNVFLSLNGPAVLSTGIALIQAQSEVELSASDIGTGAINAITTGGTSAVLSIQETSTET